MGRSSVRRFRAQYCVAVVALLWTGCASTDDRDDVPWEWRVQIKDDGPAKNTAPPTIVDNRPPTEAPKYDEAETSQSDPEPVAKPAPKPKPKPKPVAAARRAPADDPNLPGWARLNAFTRKNRKGAVYLCGVGVISGVQNEKLAAATSAQRARSSIVKAIRAPSGGKSKGKLQGTKTVGTHQSGPDYYSVVCVSVDKLRGALIEDPDSRVFKDLSVEENLDLLEQAVRRVPAK